MIEQYDPLNPPDPQEWLALDEMTRIILVLEYHTKSGEESERDHVHAVVHTVVENQVALGDDYPVKSAIERRMGEGLDRHDAIHAVGSVLAKYLWEVGTGRNKSPNFSDDYFEEVSRLTAQKWRDEYG